MAKYRITFPKEELPEKRRYFDKRPAYIKGTTIYNSRKQAEIALIRLGQQVTDRLIIEKL